MNSEDDMTVFLPRLLNLTGGMRSTGVEPTMRSQLLLRRGNRRQNGILIINIAVETFTRSDSLEVDQHLGTEQKTNIWRSESTPLI